MKMRLLQVVDTTSGKSTTIKVVKVVYGNESVEIIIHQIERLLQDYGVKGVQWTTYRGKEDLKFIVSAEVKGVKRELVIQVKPPRLLVRRRVSGSRARRRRWAT